jgi:hypothetical protein
MREKCKQNFDKNSEEKRPYRRRTIGWEDNNATILQ